MAKEILLPSLKGKHVDILERSRESIPLIDRAYDITAYCPRRPCNCRVIILYHKVTKRFYTPNIELVDCLHGEIRGYSYTFNRDDLKIHDSLDFQVLTLLALKFGVASELLFDLIEKLAPT